MTTSVYNSMNLGLNAGILSTSPISVSIESDARPEEISSFLFSLAATIQENARLKREAAAAASRDLMSNPYYLNKYGDDYAYCDELGFESSYMGARADLNHIF